MVLRSGRTTKQKRQLSNGSKVNQHLPFLCTCFNSNGKQRKEMIAHANRGQIEAIGEIALNLRKGNIIVPSSSFKRLKPHKTKQTRKHAQKMLLVPGGTIIAKYRNRTPINNSSAAYDVNTLGSRHEKYHGFFLTRRPETYFIGSTFATVSRAIKTNEERNGCKTYGGITNANASRNRDNSYDIPGRDYKTTIEKTIATYHSGRHNEVKNSRQH